MQKVNFSNPIPSCNEGHSFVSNRLIISATVVKIRMVHTGWALGSTECSIDFSFFTDAHTRSDVDYVWKGGNRQSVEIVSKQMAQFEFMGASTIVNSQTNSKGILSTKLNLCHFTSLKNNPLYTRYTMVSSGIPWHIPRVTCGF